MMKRRILFICCCGLCLVSCAPDKEPTVVTKFTNDVLLPHTPVRNQGRTQTCWAYTMASLLESDRLALAKDTVQLSVMYIVRQKYMRQFELYYYSKGKHEIRNGSLGHTFLHLSEQDGLVPYENYKGHEEGAKFHDHRDLLKRLKTLAEDAVEAKNLSLYRAKAEALLDECLGKVPDKFYYRNEEYTPHSFADSLGMDTGRYVELTSFMHHPYYESFVLEVPDNWEHAPFYNVPLDSMETYVRNALQNGQTIAWDGDTSEEGFRVRSGVALYPHSSVTQEMRQQEFERFETTDDHMMHIIGTAHDEQDNFYYILKNSWGRIGPYQGLIYMSQDYFRAKTVSVVIPQEYVNCVNRIYLNSN